MLENRIVFTGHHTNLTDDAPSAALAAYYQARAAGGAGLIVVEIASVSEKGGRYSSSLLMATSAACVPGYQRIADACHAHGTAVFAQLFHPGRELRQSVDGSSPLAYGPSDTPTERFHITPAPMTVEMIERVVADFGQAAAYLEQGGIDGVEIVAGFGFLVSQFLNPRVNRRTDRYGGSLENRMRFLREAIAAVRARTSGMAVGIRISGDEMDGVGLGAAEVREICQALDSDGSLDYFSITAGGAQSVGAAAPMVPAMHIEQGHVRATAGAIRERVTRPVIVTGRINQPHIAEETLVAGEADACGMTRALIADPEMPNKARDGRIDDIRACVACNQSCIGHAHLGAPVSCIQHPESGRELRFGRREAVRTARKVMVVGGGPGGMKAAAVAAERGHQVTLYERGGQLGGQVLLAQLLPRRAEFGRIAENLAREMALAGVTVVRNTEVTADLVTRAAPDALILATGAVPRAPEIEGGEDAHVVDAWQVVTGEANVGARVVVADWRCDWIGMGVAEKLARDGCAVTLAVNGYMAGQMLQVYMRDPWVGTLHSLGVSVVPYARLFGADGDTVYLQHTASGEPIILEGIDTLVTANAHKAETTLADSLAGWEGELHRVGDCLAPRTCEEAVLEGLEAGLAV